MAGRCCPRDQGAIFWTDGSDTWVRVSSNRGVSFAAAKKLLDGDAGEPDCLKCGIWTAPRDAAIAAGRIVLIGSISGFELFEARRLQSMDGGASWNETNAPGTFSLPNITFTAVAGVPKLAESWRVVPLDFAGPFRIRYHRQT